MKSRIPFLTLYCHISESRVLASHTTLDHALSNPGHFKSVVASLGLYFQTGARGRPHEWGQSSQGRQGCVTGEKTCMSLKSRVGQLFLGVD
jgi:hypothetical protein